MYFYNISKELAVCPSYTLWALGQMSPLPIPTTILPCCLKITVFRQLFLILKIYNILRFPNFWIMSTLLLTVLSADGVHGVISKRAGPGVHLVGCGHSLKRMSLSALLLQDAKVALKCRTQLTQQFYQRVIPLRPLGRLRVELLFCTSAHMILQIVDARQNV